MLIETNEYDKFTKMKNRLYDPSLMKILKNINIIQHIFSNKIDKYKMNKNIIHITVSINNKINYNYVLYVSMYSLLSNCNKDKTFVIYHILCTPDFNTSSIIIFKSLINKFSQNVELIFYNMGNNLIEYKNSSFTQVTYYRLYTSLFIDADRIIHLDGDTLVFSDLNEMFNLDFNNNYILGFYDILSDGIDYLRLKSNIYINAGVILINLKKMRKDKIIFQIIKMLESHIHLRNDDQTIFNYLLYPKIGRLPSKYGIWNFGDKSDINIYLSHLRTKISIKELEEAFKSPIIVHSVLCFPKPWFVRSNFTRRYTNCKRRNNCSCTKYINLWHSIAKRTEYYEEISNFTGIKNNYYCK